MIDVVSSIPTGGNFIFFAETLKARCQLCTKSAKMSDLCYLDKLDYLY